MVRHGRGPKWIAVRRYGRWLRGRYRGVREHLRGNDPQGRHLPSDKQLDFGF